MQIRKQKLLRLFPPYLAWLAVTLLLGSLALGLCQAPGSGAEIAPKKTAVTEKVELKAQEFDFTDVRLLESPFQKAMLLDANYLLQLEPDRLLSWFRKESGLEPKGQQYGGWESQGIAGHSLGHYLSAVSIAYASTGDARFRDRAAYIADELELCQRANGNGYVAAIPNGKRIFKEVSEGNIRAQGFDLNGGWVPWYTLHKLFAGLLDAHRHTANEKALAIAVKLADWAEATTADLSEELFQRMLNCEHGGMNEVLAELYARTGNEKYLKLSLRFHHKRVLEPLAKQEDRLQGLHANTQIPKLIGLARRYELTGDAADRTAAEFFWDRVAHHHSYVIGGHSDSESFGPPDQLSNRLGQNTAETCNTYNMLKLTRHLFTWHATATYADFYERALYNHILASQDPESGMMCYYVSLRPGTRKNYSTPYDSFWCCVGSGMENHVRYGESIYFHDRDSLWVNLFIPSEVRWKEKGLVLRQETRYPEADTTTLVVMVQKPTPLALRIRYPGWAKDGLSVRINGRAERVSASPGSYVELRRTWKSGDHVEVKIPMSLRLENMPDNPNRVAALYGPLVLAGELGPENDPAANQLIYTPVFITGGKPVTQWLKPVAGQPTTFRTVSVGKPRDLDLYPFYRMHHRRYSVYWDLFTPAEWEARESAHRAEVERARRLEAITVDFVQPGDTPAEREHNLRGERSSSGEGPMGRLWRHAVSGGWFSFDLKVLRDRPVSLICTYWGSDAGPRTFDIFVDGQKIATEMLQRKKPREYVDVTYPIPAELTRAKEKITVRFQGHPGNTAGGVFGVRIVRADAVLP